MCIRDSPFAAPPAVEVLPEPEPTPAADAAAAWHSWKKRPAAEWVQDRPARTWEPVGAIVGAETGAGH
eukprot:6682062-Prorocentrum_lima.AAC.1